MTLPDHIHRCARDATLEILRLGIRDGAPVQTAIEAQMWRLLFEAGLVVETEPAEREAVAK